MNQERIKVSLFKNSYSSFIELLNRQKIDYEKPNFTGGVFASGQFIVILGELAFIAKYLAPVIVEWIKARTRATGEILFLV